jgi:uncharacterized protein with HEPN domain
MTDTHTRLWRLIDLVAKEELHLFGVIARLFDDLSPTVSASRLEMLLRSPEGIDRLESFVGKFSRMQDTVMDKLIPAFLDATGEQTGTALDNLNRLHRIGFVTNPDAWIGMRRLRNKLVHEYVEDITELAAALQKARSLADELRHTFRAIRTYADENFPR